MSKYNIGEVEVDFLSSYYEQDGNHGAVLGGTGSQALNDIVFSISLNVPIDSQFILSTSVSFDSYTSASSSAIDPGIGIAYALRGDDFPLSGPSYKDQRTYGNVNFTHLYSKGKSYNIGIGFSNEYDVSSFSMNGGYGWESNDENTSVQLNIVGLRDKWSLIYPVELRYLQNVSDTLLNKDVRNTYNGALIMSRVINPIWQLAFIYDYTYQYGLLSTPFHRVIFDDGLPIDDFFKSIGIEKLPNYRHKHAVGLCL